LRIRFAPCFLMALALFLSSRPCRAADSIGPKAEDLAEARKRAIDFLKTSQSADGSWGTPMSPAVSGLVTFSLLESGVPKTDAVISKALKHLESFVQPDGGIYAPKSQHANYETSIMVLVFSAANGDKKYATLIDHADKFLRKIQWD